MSVVHLTSYDAFTAPLNYHNDAASFLRQASQELPERAIDLLAEIRRRDARAAQSIEDALNTFAQRLHAEGRSHQEAFDYLAALRIFLAQREAQFSGAMQLTFAAPSTEAPAWLQIASRPAHGCFDQLRNLLNTYEHDLYSADQTLRGIEDILWKAVNRPEQLDIHVDWSGNPFANAAGDIVNWGAENTLDPAIQAMVDFVRAHEGEIRDLVDTVRRGVEYVVLPPIDGQRLQNFIDYVAALHDAYERHVREPFVPISQGLIESFTPPPGQMRYHDSVANVPHQQAQTAEALGTLRSRLLQLQAHNETATIAQVGAAGDTGICLVAFGALVAFPPDFEVTLPTIAWRGSAIAAAVGALLDALAAIAAVFVEIAGFIIGIPLWAWVVAAAVAVVGGVIILHAAKGNVGDSGIEKELQEELAKRGISMRVITDAVRKAICDTLQTWYQSARNSNDSTRAERIKKTQKKFDCREHRE